MLLSMVAQNWFGGVNSVANTHLYLYAYPFLGDQKWNSSISNILCVFSIKIIGLRILGTLYENESLRNLTFVLALGLSTVFLYYPSNICRTLCMSNHVTFKRHHLRCTKFALHFGFTTFEVNLPGLHIIFTTVWNLLVCTMHISENEK